MQVAKAMTILTAIIALIAAIIVGLYMGKCHRKTTRGTGCVPCHWGYLICLLILPVVPICGVYFLYTHPIPHSQVMFHVSQHLTFALLVVHFGDDH